MKFYNRVQELELLQTIQDQSKTNANFTVMVGRRRIGKTALLLESVKGQSYLYLFVARKTEALLCEEYQNNAEEALGLQIYGTINRFKDLFEELMKFAIKQHFTLIIDEFQDFNNVNPSIFGDIQHVWDLYKDKSKINFIVSGSIYSMMMKIFENQKQALFARQTAKFKIQAFTVDVLKEILTDYNPDYTNEDLLCLYLLTGGVPKYIELLMTKGAVTKDAMLDSVTSPDSPFLTEGKELLISEFGKEYSTYFSILQLIASGKNSQIEIDSIIEKNTGAYLSNLADEYSLISKQRPVFSKPNSRTIRWDLNDNYLSFWFRFIFANQSVVELGKYELLREIIERDYKQYSGLILEKYFRTKIAQEERVTQVGSYWDSKGLNEIDLIALNHLEKTAIVAEIKRNPAKINLNVLQSKLSTLQSQLAPYQVEIKSFSIDDM